MKADEDGNIPELCEMVSQKAGTSGVLYRKDASPLDCGSKSSKGVDSEETTLLSW